MKGNKKTFIENNFFYKEYSKNEFLFLKMLHGIDGLHLNTIIKDNIEYIEMPLGNVISIDTIKKDSRNNLSNLIIENIPFILNQISYLNELGIFYSDALQFLYYNNKMYLIDMDTSYFQKIDYSYNNFDLLNNFLAAFEIDYSYISESLHYLDIFKSNFSFNKIEMELLKKLNNEELQKNHIYFCRNKRHIQADIKNIHIYGKYGNMIITDNLINKELMIEWELIKIK
jgi:hypothetical protein